MFPPNMNYAPPPQGRGNNPAVPNYFPNQTYVYPHPHPHPQMMPTYNQQQAPVAPIYFSTNMGPLLRPNLNVHPPQQNPGHVGSPAPIQAQAQGPVMPGPRGPPSQEKNKRRSHAIPIVNPETGKDLLDEICSEGSSSAVPSRSGKSGARQASQPASRPVENIIAAEFAAKVAIAAGEDSNVSRVQQPLNISTLGECGGPPRLPVNVPSSQLTGVQTGVVGDFESSSASISQQKQGVPLETKDNVTEMTILTNVGEPWKNKYVAPSTLPKQAEFPNTQIESNSNQPLLSYATVTDAQAVTSSVNNMKPFDDSANEIEGVHVAISSGTLGLGVENPPQTSMIMTSSESSGMPGAPIASEAPTTVPVRTNTAQPTSGASGPSVMSLPQRTKRESPEGQQLMEQQQLQQTTVESVEDFDPTDGKEAQWRQAKGRNKSQRDTINRHTEQDGSDLDIGNPLAASKEEKKAASILSTDPDPATEVPVVHADSPIAPPQTSAPVEGLEVVDSKECLTGSPTEVQEKTEAPAAIPNSSANEENMEKEMTTTDGKIVAAPKEESNQASTDAVAQPSLGSNPMCVDKPPEASKQLVYNKDQWSPLNLEGKKKYERDFLMQLKSDPQSMKRPEDLPKLEVVITDSYKNRSNDPRPLGTLNRGGANADSLLMPKFMNLPTNRNSLTKRNSQQGKAKAPKVIQLNLSLNEEVKLNETENAWRPTRLSKAEEFEATHEDLYKKVRSVLNKLTPQKFDLLVDQVKALPIDTRDKLEGVINLVFEKAVDEPNFSVAYAMMCHTLSGMQVVAKNKDGKDNKSNADNANFKKLLLMRCQAEFEKQRDSKDNLRREERLKEIESVEGEKKKELEMQLEEEDRRIRMKYVGVNRFIGELYKRNMLTGNIMVQCITKLLEANDEESLECLCKLLTTIGKELETRVERDKKVVDLTQHFHRMKSIVDSRKTSSRIRFMLQDVIELRADKWRPRRGDSNPKTMDEIAKEAERESLTQLATPPAHSVRSSKEDRDREKDRDRRRGRTGVSDDGWTTQGGGGRISTPRGPVEISKLKVKNSDIDLLNLGSKNQFTSWSKGSGGHKSKSDIIGNVGSNPFTVLSAEMEKPGMPHSKEMVSGATSRSTGRDAALAEVRKNTSVGADLPVMTGLSRPGSRDNSVRRDETPTPKASTPTSISSKSPEILPEADLENKARLLIDEYLVAENAQDLLQCVQEEIHPSQISDMVSRWLLLALEWSPVKRSRTANALFVLYNEGKMNIDQHALPALSETLTITEDLLIDIPMTYKYLAELIVPLLKCEAINFPMLKRLLKADMDAARKFLKECVKLLQKEVGPGWIVPRWKMAEMSWSDYLVPGENIDHFLTENGLNYFIDSSKEGEKLSISSSQQPQDVMSYQEMHDRLVKLMPENSYDDVVQWIAFNIGKEIRNPKYIRALMTAICEVGTHQEKNQWKLNVESFNLHSKLIQRYVDNTEVLELQALYAIQAFVTRLMHPPSLLTSILSTLLEEGILSRDSIQTWVKSEDPAEAEGRGVALKSINQFITWLDEPEYDSLEEGL